MPTTRGRARHAAVAALALTLGLAACGGDDGDDEDASPTTTEPAAPETSAPVITGPTAQAVLDAFTGAGLPVPNPRDNTAQSCGSIGCTSLITTDVLSVREWPDDASAQRWVEAAIGDPPVVVGGTTTVDFASGGTTPPYDRPAFDTVLAGLG